MSVCGLVVVTFVVICLPSLFNAGEIPKEWVEKDVILNELKNLKHTTGTVYFVKIMGFMAIFFYKTKGVCGKSLKIPKGIRRHKSKERQCNGGKKIHAYESLCLLYTIIVYILLLLLYSSIRLFYLYIPIMF